MDDPKDIIKKDFVNPWENRAQIGLLKAYWRTCIAFFFSPRIFFSNLNIETPLLSGILFIFLTLLLVYPIISLSLFVDFLTAHNIPFLNSPFGIPVFLFVLIEFVLLAAFGAFLHFITAAVYNMYFSLMGGKGGYRGTFWLIAYIALVALVGGFIFLIPSIGPILGHTHIHIINYIAGIIFSFFYLIIGLKQVHQMSTTRAIVTVILSPLFFLIFFIIIALVVFLIFLLLAIFGFKFPHHSMHKFHLKSSLASSAAINIQTPAVAMCKIGGFLYSTDRPSVLINDNPYGINETACGWKIIAISPTAVTMQLNDQKISYRSGETFSAPLPVASDIAAVHALVAKGWALENQEKDQEALALYNQALQLDPKDFLVHKHLGIHWSREGKYGDGIQELKLAVELNPKDASSSYNLGLVYQWAKQYQNALGSYNQAIALNPSYYNAIINRGTVNLILTNYKEAVDDFSNCLAMNPKEADAYMYRGESYLGLKDKTSAQADFDKALLLKPGLAPEIIKAKETLLSP